MKTSELKGRALDWAAAKCEDFKDWTAIIRIIDGRVTKIIPGGWEEPEVYTKYSPSTDWAQGGPIIDREKIDLFNDPNGKDWCMARSWVNFKEFKGEGSTQLIAAMRCYVASKLGDEVDIPEELK